MEERIRLFSEGSNLTSGPPSHGSTPKALPPNPIALGVRMPHTDLEKMQAFSLEQKAIFLGPFQVRRD